MSSQFSTLKKQGYITHCSKIFASYIPCASGSTHVIIGKTTDAKTALLKFLHQSKVKVDGDGAVPAAVTSVDQGN